MTETPKWPNFEHLWWNILISEIMIFVHFTLAPYASDFRGDVVHHHVVVKAGDETRSLLTANRNGDTGNESVVLATPHAGSDVMDHV
jgi:hypothetical protein